MLNIIFKENITVFIYIKKTDKNSEGKKNLQLCYLFILNECLQLFSYQSSFLIKYASF